MQEQSRLSSPDLDGTSPHESEETNPFSFSIDEIKDRLEQDDDDSAVIESEASQSMYKGGFQYEDDPYEHYDYYGGPYYGDDYHGGKHYDSDYRGPSYHGPDYDSRRKDDCKSCGSCGYDDDYDKYYDKCGVLESPNLCNLRILKPSVAEGRGQRTTHSDNITVNSSSLDNFANSA